MAIPILPPPSAKAVEIGERVKAFLEEHIIPAEPVYARQLDEGGDRWSSPPIMKVAVRSVQHSKMFGQRASWQTVWRFRFSMSFRT